MGGDLSRLQIFFTKYYCYHFEKRQQLKSIWRKCWRKILGWSAQRWPYDCIWIQDEYWVMQFHALIYKIWINYAKPPRKIPVIISPKKRIWRPVVVSAGLIYLADVVCLHLGNVGGPLSPASSGNLADAPVQPITRKERPRAHNNFWNTRYLLCGPPSHTAATSLKVLFSSLQMLYSSQQLLYFNPQILYSSKQILYVNGKMVSWCTSLT